MAYLGNRWFVLTLCVLVPAFISIKLGRNELEASLSARATLLHPGSLEFANASLRWSAANSPTYSVVVQVATEVDVQNTITYANRKRKPFLAISGGHGQTSTVGNVQGGVGIHLGRMNNISIVDNGRAAVIQGGVLTGDLITYLWAHGKQTMTTGCDCVGYLAPLLGGGHGWLKGRYGTASDQLLSARLVLANGTAIIASEDDNTELFWALRGAGHNFGIVTEATVKIYDVKPSEKHWAASGFVFTQDKLESVFSVANEALSSPQRPAEMIYYLVAAFNPDIDRDFPIIIAWIYYQASAIPTKFTDPMYALSPVAVDTSVTDLAGVNTHLLAAKDGASCAKGFSRKMSPVSLQSYHLLSIRKAFDIFAAVPPPFRDSVMFFEDFPTKRTEEIDANSTAYSNRAGKLLISPLLTYSPNVSLDATADDINERIRDALLEGSQSRLVAYVNYARGDESIEAVYGYEPWRLEKLRRLKKDHDPFGRFNYYAPIS